MHLVKNVFLCIKKHTQPEQFQSLTDSNQHLPERATLQSSQTLRVCIHITFFNISFTSNIHLGAYNTIRINVVEKAQIMIRWIHHAGDDMRRNDTEAHLIP